MIYGRKLNPIHTLEKIFHKNVKKFQNWYCILKIPCYNEITNSIKHLVGTYYEEDGTHYEGYFYLGKKHGDGKLYNSNNTWQKDGAKAKYNSLKIITKHFQMRKSEKK